MTKSAAQLDAEIARELGSGSASPGDKSPDQFVGFQSWPDVIQAALGGGRLWYKAPLDWRPRPVRIAKIYKNKKLRVDPMSNQADPFTADAGHTDRFFLRQTRSLDRR